MRVGVNSRTGGTSDGARGGGRGEQRGPRANDDRQTDRLGPYLLGPCVEDGEQGRVYKASHLTTGAPALVFRPTGEDPEAYPQAAWRVLVTSSVTPSYCAAEVVEAPAGVLPRVAAEELPAVLKDMANVTEGVSTQTEVVSHLLTPPPSRWQRFRGRARRRAVQTRELAARRWKDVALAAAVAGFLSLLWQRPEPTRAEVPRGPVPGGQLSVQNTLTSTVGEASLEELEAPVLLVTSGLPIARDMPSKPFKVQARPPCKGSQKAINGGCWIKAAEEAPCPDDLYEYKGGCYAPVKNEDGDAASRSISR